MLTFKPSKPLTLGVELEIQIIDRDGFDLIGLADDLMEQLTVDSHINHIKPEMTQSMLEINSSVHESANELLSELKKIRDSLVSQTTKLNIYLTGGGTHPFQMWNDRKIYPARTYQSAADKYGYLAKMFTVFGLHIHIGCANGDDAIYLMHSLAHYLPQFIALSASSPFCQGEDTEFDSARCNVVNAFPLSGLAKINSSWADFCDYFAEIKQLQMVENLDNFYWDIRPKPNFGTVEIRICDAPLTVEKTAMLAAYAQTLAAYILKERPFINFNEDQQLYRYNRFQASRYGFDAIYIDPISKQRKIITEDILKTCKLLEKYAKELANENFFSSIIDMVTTGQNDAKWLRNLFTQGETLEKIVYLQTQLWEGRIESYSL